MTLQGNDSNTSHNSPFHLTSAEQEWLTQIRENIHEHNDSVKPRIATLQLDPAHEPPLYFEDDFTPPYTLLTLMEIS